MVGYLNSIASTADLEQKVSSLSIKVILASTLFLIVLISLAALFANKKHKKLKTPLFSLIVAVVLLGTATLFGGTIYLNLKSDSGGPVHWHADIEIWACGIQVELRNPSGLLSNKIGTSTLHEHNDQRIHLEGVVVDDEKDATIGKFMRVIGGSINDYALDVPLAYSITEDFIDGDVVDVGGVTNIEKFIKTNSIGDKTLELKDGATCINGDVGDLQVFVYQFNKGDNTYYQKKVTSPENYTIRDESIVPPGDCIIVEFSKTKDSTDKLCEQYGVRDAKRCVEFGVKKYSDELCNIREVKAIERPL